MLGSSYEVLCFNKEKIVSCLAKVDMVHQVMVEEYDQSVNSRKS